jgi:hypothetical protein
MRIGAAYDQLTSGNYDTSQSRHGYGNGGYGNRYNQQQWQWHHQQQQHWQRQHYYQQQTYDGHYVVCWNLRRANPSCGM